MEQLEKKNLELADTRKKLEEAQAKFAKIMGDGVNKFVTKSVKNPIGKTWVKNQKELVKNKKRFN